MASNADDGWQFSYDAGGDDAAANAVANAVNAATKILGSTTRVAQPPQNTGGGKTIAEWAASYNPNDNSMSGIYADMYKNQQQQTQKNNARALNSAQSAASQQAALKGWNPEMAASYVNHSTAGVHDANMQANQNLMDTELQLRQQSIQEREADRRRQIEQIAKTNPEFAEKLWMQREGIDPVDMSEFIDDNGNRKPPKSEAEKALEQQVKEYNAYNDMVNKYESGNLDKNSAEYRIAKNWVNEYNIKEAQAEEQRKMSVPVGAAEKDISLLDNFTKSELEQWAEKNNIVSLDDTDSKLGWFEKQPNGTLVIYQGKPYIKTYSYTRKYKRGDDSHDYRYYKVTLTDPTTGKTLSLTRDRRAANYKKMPDNYAK
jgi:hypothetical protein